PTIEFTAAGAARQAHPRGPPTHCWHLPDDPRTAQADSGARMKEMDRELKADVLRRLQDQ
ncbi:hypothetical protein, partial [Pseudomonas aeruginosa]|uniref:hypothetical protein n=1 Tax=Pseudomonas aeruginosa TaxID=287 RepID=UPI0031B6B084